MPGQRIADKSLIRIIRKWLRAGVMDEWRQWSSSTEGVLQGRITPPLLGNIYPRFVQDLWIRKSSNLPLVDLVVTPGRRPQGTWNYDGVIGNSECNWKFAWFARQLVFKHLNRRSQRKSFTWASFAKAWERWGSPSPRVMEKPWPHV